MGQRKVKHCLTTELNYLAMFCYRLRVRFDFHNRTAIKQYFSLLGVKTLRVRIIKSKMST
jgi:hypothetical protein